MADMKLIGKADVWLNADLAQTNTGKQTRELVLDLRNELVKENWFREKLRLKLAALDV